MIKLHLDSNDTHNCIELVESRIILYIILLFDWLILPDNSQTNKT